MNQNRSERSEHSSCSTEKPTSFLCKVKSFFGLGKKSTACSTPRGERSEHPTVRRAQAQRDDQRRQDRGPRPERMEKAPRSSSGPRPELEEPNPDAVVVPRLYVGNLAYETSESDLFDLFSKVGNVRNVELVMDRRSNRSKGFGFVEMGEIETAKKAVMELHRMEFMGRPIVVSGAKSERREGVSTPEVPPIE